jgi:HJR/Mrr/RecB family endonuclease
MLPFILGGLGLGGVIGLTIKTIQEEQHKQKIIQEKQKRKQFLIYKIENNGRFECQEWSLEQLEKVYAEVLKQERLKYLISEIRKHKKIIFDVNDLEALEKQYADTLEEKKIEEEKRQNSINLKIDKMDTMTGKEFENFLYCMYSELGYKVVLTQDSQDYGVDLVLYKNGIKTIVQAKRRNSSVGLNAVQEIVAGIKYYKADKGIVITNNYFTNNAHNLASANEVILINRDALIDLIYKVKNTNN